MAGRRPRETEDEGRVGDETITDAKDRRPKPAIGYLSVMLVVDVMGHAFNLPVLSAKGVHTGRISPVSTHIENVQDLESLVGKHLGTSPRRIVTQAMINSFADLTDDHQWLHVNEERATSGPFGATIAHGYLTLSLVAPLIHDVLTTDHQGFRVNYGLDRVRFPSALIVGSEIWADVVLQEFRPIAEGVHIVLETTVHSSTSEKPVCVAHGVYRYYDL